MINFLGPVPPPLKSNFCQILIDSLCPSAFITDGSLFHFESGSPWSGNWSDQTSAKLSWAIGRLFGHLPAPLFANMRVFVPGVPGPQTCILPARTLLQVPCHYTHHSYHTHKHIQNIITFTANSPHPTTAIFPQYCLFWHIICSRTSGLIWSIAGSLAGLSRYQQNWPVSFSTLKSVFSERNLGGFRRIGQNLD